MSRVAVLVLLTAALAGCAGAEARPVPDVTGLRLDVAEDELESSGLAVRVLGGGVFGVIVESRWEVCDQEPLPGGVAARVTLVVDRECEYQPFQRDVT